MQKYWEPVALVFHRIVGIRKWFGPKHLEYKICFNSKVKYVGSLVDGKQKINKVGSLYINKGRDNFRCCIDGTQIAFFRSCLHSIKGCNEG